MFAVLVEDSIIPQSELADLQRMAQFRNVIVHHYARIDPEIVFMVLKSNPEIIRRFGTYAGSLL